MFVVAEITEWDQEEPTLYFGGYFEDPKYKHNRPLWGHKEMAEKFDTHEKADRFAGDLTDYHAMKGYPTCGFVVIGLEEGA